MQRTKIQWMTQLGVTILVAGWLISGHTLDSDRNQPMTLEADEFELDFKTGVRIYRGDVLLQQGSIRLDCDELLTYINDQDQLDKAICDGKPGKFKQRPEGAKHDMIATGLKIIFNQIDEQVIIKGRAQVSQNDKTMTGQLITYYLATEKAIAKGGSGISGAEGNTTGSASSRAKLVLQPRKKKGTQ